VVPAAEGAGTDLVGAFDDRADLPYQFTVPASEMELGGDTSAAGLSPPRAPLSWVTRFGAADPRPKSALITGNYAQCCRILPGPVGHCAIPGPTCSVRVDPYLARGLARARRLQPRVTRFRHLSTGHPQRGRERRPADPGVTAAVINSAPSARRDFPGVSTAGSARGAYTPGPTRHCGQSINEIAGLLLARARSATSFAKPTLEFQLVTCG
jgi:hypothetical protein